MDKSPLFAGLKFTKDLGKNSDLEDEFEQSVKETSKISKDKKASKKEPDDDIVDLGSDDDYIYVDHSHDDERVLEEDEPIIFGKSINPDVDEDIQEDNVDLEYEEVIDEPVDDVKADEPMEDVKADEVIIDEPVGDVEVDEPMEDVKADEVSIDEPVGDVEVDEPMEDVKSDDPVEDDKVDLGSDDDYIYVDHSDNEPTYDDENADDELDKSPAVNNHVRNRHGVKEKINSFISDVMNSESQLEPEEIETLRGEVIEDDDGPLHKPAPSDDYVVEAEIVNGDEDLNIFNDELPDLNQDVSSDGESEFDELKKPTPKFDFDSEDEDLNIFTDRDLHFDTEIREEATRVVDNAVSEFMDDVFDNIDVDDEVKENDEPIEQGAPQENDEHIVEDVVEKPADDYPEADGVTYYKGATDVKSKLRKNNFYYDDEKHRSVRDSIKGFKRDMKYINRSLKEIENPTQIDYVSVVDRTEEYNPEDYLNMPSDDDSHLIIEKEEGLTFAEQEEKRIEKELMMEALEKEIADEENVIVTAHEQHRREELKDQALEDIIISANEDYKELEKERYQSSNTLKSFDDQKLPGKGKMEDNIVDYVQAEDIGLSSQDDLYKKPVSEVAKSVNYIVDVEGPIHVNEVIKRVKDSCEIKRAGSNLKKTVNAAISEAESSGNIIRIGDFLYDASNNNVLIRKRNKPNIDLISDEEISKNIEVVLLYNQNLNSKQVAKETSRNFGFKSTSKKTADRINGVLDLMIANNKVKITDDIVELN